MNCTNCNTELPVKAKFCPECGTKVATRGISVDQDIGTVKGEVTGVVIDKTPTGGGMDASVDQDIQTVEEGGAVAGAIVGSGDSPIHVGGKQQYGDVIEGDKVKGDKVQGDKVEGDVVHGDQVDGDKTTVGDISGSTGVAIGREAQSTLTTGLGGEEIAKLFAGIYQEIESRAEELSVDKEVLTHTVQKIEEETGKGENADSSRVESLLKTLAKMAPEIFEVAAAALANPAAGIAAVVRNVIKKVQKETGKA